MTFLELCQRLRQEVGAAGSGPANVSGQSGEYARLIGWVREAWREIQLHRDHWRFDWAKGAIDVTSEFREYPLPGDFRHWDDETLRLHGRPLHVISWATFRDDYREPSGQAPRRVAIAPDNTLHLDRFPTSSDAISFEYWRIPQALESGGDVPRLPERYHMLIVYQAMLQYAMYENAPEVAQQARMNYQGMMNEVARSELPSMTLGGPLA